MVSHSNTTAGIVFHEIVVAEKTAPENGQFQAPVVCFSEVPGVRHHD
jgi:hypothetical protein